MKLLNPEFQAALTREVTAIAWCWLIERQDGFPLGFTSLDTWFYINGMEYRSFSGFTPTADSNSEGMENNNSQELVGLLTSEQISASDILAGFLDGAILTCFQVDVTNLPTSLTEDPPKFLISYPRYIKRTVLSDLGFRLELRDDDWKLETKLGKQTKKICGYDLGGPGCDVDLTPYTFITTINTVTNRYQFTVDGSFNVDQFSRGKITFNNGNNQGVSRDVATFETLNLVTLWQPLPYSISLGDEVTIIQGCGKTLYDCVVRYNNALKIDAEPHIPTADQAFNLPIDD